MHATLDEFRGKNKFGEQIGSGRIFRDQLSAAVYCLLHKCGVYTTERNSGHSIVAKFFALEPRDGPPVFFAFPEHGKGNATVLSTAGHGTTTAKIHVRRPRSKKTPLGRIRREIRSDWARVVDPGEALVDTSKGGAGEDRASEKTEVDAVGTLISDTSLGGGTGESLMQRTVAQRGPGAVTRDLEGIDALTDGRGVGRLMGDPGGGGGTTRIRAGEAGPQGFRQGGARAGK